MYITRSQRRGTVVLTAAGAIACLVLTSCGGGDDDGELTEASVGAMPIADSGPLWLGIEQGFFEDEGLDLEFIETTGGAVQVPGVLADEYDFAFANIVTGMVAHDQDLPVQYIVNGSSVTGDPEEDVAAVIVPEDSPVETVEDLESTTMTSNNLNNVGDTAIRAAMDLNEYDGGSADFIELAFGEAMSVAEQGQVDAVLLVEPYKTIAMQEHDARIIMHPYTETDENFDIGGFLATEDMLESDPETVEAFQRGTARSLEYAQENPEELREVILENTTIEEDVVDDITLPTFRAEFDREAAEVIADSAHGHGVVDDPIDLDDLLPEEYTE